MSVELGGPLLYSCSLEPSPSLLLTVQLGRWPSRIHRELSSGVILGYFADMEMSTQNAKAAVTAVS